MSSRRFSLLLLALLVAACANETRLRPERISVTRVPAANGLVRVNIEVSVPRGVSFGEAMRPPVLLADKGSFNAITSTLEYGGKTATMVEATFLMPPDARPERLFLGRYDLDFARGELLLRK